MLIYHSVSSGDRGLIVILQLLYQISITQYHLTADDMDGWNFIPELLMVLGELTWGVHQNTKTPEGRAKCQWKCVSVSQCLTFIILITSEYCTWKYYVWICLPSLLCAVDMCESAGDTFRLKIWLICLLPQTPRRMVKRTKSKPSQLSMSVWQPQCPLHKG